MKESDEIILINNILAQAEVFLKEQGAFYPFGSAIGKMGELKPLGVYLEEETLSVTKLVELLRQVIDEKLETGEYIIAVIAVDVVVKEDNVNKDAIQIDFFERNKSQNKKYIKYKIEGGQVEFTK